MKKQKTYVCKRLKLMNYLSDNNFYPYKAVRDKLNPMYYVWLYTDSDELQEAITEYYSQPSHMQ